MRRTVFRQEYTHERASKQVQGIMNKMASSEKKFSDLLSQVHPNFKLSGTNLIHYLVLRNNEVREAQEYLHKIGLSSLTNSESHTFFQLQNVLHWLDHEPLKKHPTACNFEEASRQRQYHAEQLLGVYPNQDRPHIMVTFSAEFIQNPVLVKEMLMAGMTVARINCAHDSPDVWLSMIQALNKGIAKTGKSCKIYMDLAGPKIRIREIVLKGSNKHRAMKVEEGKEILLEYATEEEIGIAKRKPREWDTLYVEPKEILTMVKPGDPIFFDDGKFEARVLAISNGRVRVKIIRISTKKPLLKEEKGINLPESELEIPTLTEEDKINLPFICRHADLIGYSFVNTPSDIELLRSEIKKYSLGQQPHIVLKIERLHAVHNLPALLLNGMKDEALGVMIARGDLAVEIGFERLSEIQEEILWICEAAHVPVIWATQVLETLCKTGYATRSEITDAAMSVRAECVMLNKGKYIVKTIKTLDDILNRQLGHLDKKRYILRPLGIAKTFLGVRS